MLPKKHQAPFSRQGPARKRAPSYFANGILQSYQESLFTGQEELQEEDVFDEEELDESDPFYFSEGPKL